MSAAPQFYWTVHPGDLIRERLLPGAAIMLVASACWDEARHRFRITRPPADHIGTLALDSGGFTAARRWGRYPWTPQQYVDWIGEVARDVPLAFVAVMDYACERGVNRAALATNQARIRSTLRNERTLRTLAPSLPWLGVLQGNTLAERAYDVQLRHWLGLLRGYMGVGSICGRTAKAAAGVLRFYAQALPGTRFHAFGLDVRTLDQGDDVWAALRSWDSYAWNWGRGQKGVDRPPDLDRQPGETRSAHTQRLAGFYDSAVLTPRFTRPRQGVLL